METVQLQCGHCRKVMAISVEHLGGQVQCPHCKGVVQTAAPTPAAQAAPNVDVQQRESIFAGPEASDAVLGEQPAPRIEMPAPSDGPASTESGPPSEPDADLTRFKPRPVYEKSVLGMYALIFLVPYAILSTLAILYLVFVQQDRRHPLDLMPDPVPDAKKGGPKHVMRPTHTQPLAEHQKVAIGEWIRVGKDGDLKVKPEKVAWTEAGDLELVLRAKNISANTTFEPIHDSWIKYIASKKGDEPYTFLESHSHNIANIYGAYLVYRKGPNEKDEGSAVLRPDQEALIILTIDKSPLLAAVAKSNDSYTWRVQLRRGFVKHGGVEKSTTAVIGVEFTSADIGKKG